MTDRHALRRRLLAATYATGGAGFLGVCLVLGTNSLHDNDAYGGIASALAALGTIFAAIVAYLRRGRPTPQPDEADETFVATLLAYWEPELRNRRTSPAGEPRTIPLTWEEAGEGFGDDPAAVIGTKELGETRLRLDGRLDENPDAAARRLAAGFSQLPGSKRLVVLGEPGAGKTFLAITLVVGLLRRWRPGEPVAVFLSLASWDPIVESLDDWMAREIASLYQGGQVDAAENLLTRQRVLPILDGLDELPEHARRLAVTRINHTLDGDRPIVLTCRTAEYDEGLAGGAPVLLRAAVVRVLPVAVDDIVAYLAKDPAWDELTSHVERNRDSPVAGALATPLMLSLFGAVYDGRSPEDLLSDPHLATRHEVEDHLVDELLDSAYPATPVRRGGWTAKKARRWLTYLAKHLHGKNVRDLSPWQLARDEYEPAILATIAMIPAGLYLLLADTDAVVMMAMLGVAGAAGLIANARKAPGRGGHDDKHNAETFGFGMVVGTSAVLVAGFVFFLLDFLTSDRSYSDIADFAAATAASAGIAVVAGLGFGLNELMVANLLARGNAKVGGRDFLVRDRSSALRATAMATVFVGLVAIPSATIAAAFGGYLGKRIAVAVGALPAVVDMHLPPLDRYVPWEVTLGGRDGMVVTSLWFALVFAAAVLVTRTWTWLLLLRWDKAPPRKLPWRLMRFLEDGRRRGIFRGSGGYYQFGHVRLQERLVATAATSKERPATRKIRIVVAVVASVVLLGGLVSVWAASPPSCRSVGWSALDERMTSVVSDGETGCFATLDDEDWAVLRGMSADPAKLAELNPEPFEATYPRPVFVVGELDRLSTARWDHLLDGVIAAQKAVEGHLTIAFVHADVASTRDTDIALLTADYVALGTGTPSAAVQVDIGDSLLPADKPAVIGLNSGDLDELVANRVADLTETWLKTGGLPDVPPRAFADGVSDEECRKLADADKTLASGYFDLRDAKNAVDVLSDVADCGQAVVLVDDATSRSLSQAPQRLAALTIMHVKDVRNTIRPACENELLPGTHPDVLASCVAVSSAYSLANGLLVGVRR